MDHASTDKEEDDRHLDWSALYWLERTVICVVTGERFFLSTGVNKRIKNSF
jgi:hypothetical protein